MKTRSSLTSSLYMGGINTWNDSEDSRREYDLRKELLHVQMNQAEDQKWKFYSISTSQSNIQ